jgi:transcriptional regulator with XRE-family HTH domain
MGANIDSGLIRKLRTTRSWSQEELAQITDLNVRTIQRIETDGSASLESRRALAAAFGLSPEDLLVGIQETGTTDFVERPKLGTGYGTILGGGLVAGILACIVTTVGISLALASRKLDAFPLFAFFAAVDAIALCTIGYCLWASATATYRISADRLTVHFGVIRRDYRWDEFDSAFRLKGFIPVKLSFQPCTRLRDAVYLRMRGGRSTLELTPQDPENFLKRIAALVPA